MFHPRDLQSKRGINLLKPMLFFVGFGLYLNTITAKPEGLQKVPTSLKNCLFSLRVINKISPLKEIDAFLEKTSELEEKLKELLSEKGPHYYGDRDMSAFKVKELRELIAEYEILKKETEGYEQDREAAIDLGLNPEEETASRLVKIQKSFVQVNKSLINFLQHKAPEATLVELTVRNGNESTLAIRQLADHYSELVKKFGIRVSESVEDKISNKGSRVISKISLHIYDPRAWILLRAESGKHVFQMPYEKRFNPRYNSDVWVNVVPERPLEKVHFSEKEIQLEFAKSSGGGGQNANKVETAVIAKDPKTGISVKIESERSQAANKLSAIKKLKEKIQYAMAEQDLNFKQELRKANMNNLVRIYDLINDQIRDHLTESTHPAYLFWCSEAYQIENQESFNAYYLDRLLKGDDPTLDYF
jgi:protein subunit release factor A